MKSDLRIDQTVLASVRAWLVDAIVEAIGRALSATETSNPSAGSTAGPQEDGGLLTAQDISEYLKVPSRRVYELARRGEVPCVRIGRQIRFRREALEDWLAQREAQARGSDLTIVS